MEKRNFVSVPYGSDSIQIDIPENNIGYYRGSKKNAISTDNRSQFDNALENPVGAYLKNLAANRSVMCLIYDASRKVPQKDFLESTFPHLKSASSVSVMLTTGTHDGNTSENEAIVADVKEIARLNNINLTRVIIHDCHNDDMTYAGRTKSRDNDIYLNKHLQSAEVFLVFSDMKNHYFAGYSNAIKNFFPGVAKYDSVERNHSLAMNKNSTFGCHPLHPDPARRNNPLAQDMWEAYQLITCHRPVYLVATITSDMDILWIKAGLLEDVLPLGIAKVDEHLSVRVHPADKMIVCCGGFPNDESLYMAQRALELSRAGVKDGGEVLFLAECRNGIGPQKSIENFYQPLTYPVDEILKKMETRKYIMYAHKTYKFALMIRELKAIKVFSAMADELISKIHLTPVHDVQQTIDTWISADPGVKINVFGEGSNIAVHSF